MVKEIYEMYKRNFPYINREEKNALKIIVNENAIIFLAVDENYRNIESK